MRRGLWLSAILLLLAACAERRMLRQELDQCQTALQIATGGAARAPVAVLDSQPSPHIRPPGCPMATGRLGEVAAQYGYQFGQCVDAQNHAIPENCCVF